MRRGWLPIRTAPKGGQYILVCDDEGDMTVAHWYSHMVRGVERGGWRLAQSGAYAEDDELNSPPTHWMPLPPPAPKITDVLDMPK